MAREGWRDLQLNDINKKLLECKDAQECIKEFFSLERGLKLKIIALLWWIWQKRNNIVAGDTKKAQDAVSFLARRSAAEFEQYFGQSNKVKQQKIQSWVPPIGETLKINIDGSFIKDRKSVV